MRHDFLVTCFGACVDLSGARPVYAMVMSLCDCTLADAVHKAGSYCPEHLCYHCFVTVQLCPWTQRAASCGSTRCGLQLWSFVQICVWSLGVRTSRFYLMSLHCAFLFVDALFTCGAGCLRSPLLARWSSGAPRCQAGQRAAAKGVFLQLRSPAVHFVHSYQNTLPLLALPVSRRARPCCQILDW